MHWISTCSLSSEGELSVRGCGASGTCLPLHKWMTNREGVLEENAEKGFPFEEFERNIMHIHTLWNTRETYLDDNTLCCKS